MLVLMTAVGGVVVPRSSQPQECPDQPKIVTELGTREQVPTDFAPVADGAVPYPAPAQTGARYVRVRLEVSHVPDCPWFLTARDAEFRPVQVFGHEEFRTATTLWTQRVKGTHVIFDLQRCRDNRAPDVRFVEYIWMPEKATNTYYSSQKKNAPTFRPIAEVDTARRKLGDVVGFFISSWGRTSWVCSGVMLTPDLFLTNWHCGAPPTVADKGFWNKDVLRDTLIDLSFDGDGRSRELLVKELAAAPNKALDFVVLRTTAIDVLGPVRPVRISPTDVSQTQPLLVVHHPAGAIKQLSWNCAVVQDTYEGWQDTGQATEFTHRCDTESGSSGAPVLNETGQLVGLHHLGFGYDKERCEFRDHENKAVKISAILGALQRDAKAVYDEIMTWQNP